MKKTVESTECAWNKSVTFQEMMEQTEKSCVVYIAVEKRAAERWTQCEDARFNGEEYEWDGSKRRLEESDTTR